MGAFAWDLSLSFAWDCCVLALGTFGLEFVVWELQFGMYSFGSLGSFTVAWDLSLGNCSVDTFIRDFSLGRFSFVSLWNCRFRSLGNFRLESTA